MMTKQTLSEVEKTEIRERAAKVLSELRQESSSMSHTTGGGPEFHTTDNLFFHHAGFLHIPSFANATECSAMKQQMEELAENQWDPTESLDAFGTNDRQNTARGDYFLESSNKVHFFAEPDAIEQDSQGRSRLKDLYQANKLAALNKAGHALHLQEGAFRTYCLSDKLKKLVQGLGWKDPVVPQSMYIFKQARTGGVVNSHQDSVSVFMELLQTFFRGFLLISRLRFMFNSFFR
jgi:phytanoyl-CoA hydroxylase